MKKIAIINGPNLNMLGTREPEIYGTESLEDIITYTSEKLKDHNVELEWFQSNIEGEIVEEIQRLKKSSDYKSLIINPAAYSHTSVAIYDALLLIDIPIVEVHLSNTHAREDFRQNKLTARASKIIIEGLGKDAYYIGVLTQFLKE